MTNQVKYKADYLKITSTDKAHPVKNITDVLEEYSAIVYQSNRSEKIDSRVFGTFYEHIRTHNWVVLRFDPYSVDCGIQKKDTAYKTRGQALNAAIQYLNNKGYQAKAFDLEGMIDKI